MVLWQLGWVRSLMVAFLPGVRLCGLCLLDLNRIACVWLLRALDIVLA